MKKYIYFALFLIVATSVQVNGQTQANDIDASLDNSGDGVVEVIFTPNVALTGVGNPLNVWVRVPSSQSTGTTVSITDNPFNLAFTGSFSFGGFFYYQYQAQPTIDLTTWDPDVPVSIVELDFDGPAIDIELFGGDFAVSCNPVCIWPGTALPNENGSNNLVTWPVDAMVSLPVELLSFEAEVVQRKHVDLSWKTAVEIDNDYFIVERSQDGINFESIAQLPGAGNIELIQHYEHLDLTPYVGINYYRLKQVDYDGTTSYSEVRAVEVYSERLRLFPNPTINDLSIALDDLQKGEVDLNIYDLKGKLLYSDQLEVEEGVITLQLSTANIYAAGAYVLSIDHQQRRLGELTFIKIE